MDKDVVISVENISKKFRVYIDKGSQLKERMLFKERNRYEDRPVLKDISFSVRKGEAIGLVGHNGCGKSTTLKLLTRIMYPDSGKITMKGRVVALIELGLFVFCVVVTKYVSVGSICLVLGLMVSYTIFAYTGSYGFTSDSMKLESCIVLGLITLLAIYRHKQNIVRLIKGTENKFSLKDKSKTKEEQA